MIFLPSHQQLSEPERLQLPERCEALAQHAWNWFEPARDRIPEKTFRVLAELLAAAAPREPVARLSPSMRFCVWMYLLDYYVDEMPGIDRAHLTALESRIDNVLEGVPLPAGAPFLEQSLAALCSELAQSKAAPMLLPLFVAQIRRELRASILLFEGRSGDCDEIEDYLEHAAQCVNHISCCLSLALALGDALPPASGPALLETLQPAARAIRLANDLRTHSKDEAEGRPHALAFGWDEAAVKRAILESLEDFGARALALDCPARTITALRRLTQLGVEIYGITDIKMDL